MTYTTYSSLRGRTVFISGGSSGIGAELVRAFAQQGSHVAFCGTKAGGGDALIAELTQAGHAAPFSIHVVKTRICSGLSLPPKGIFSPSWRIARSRRLPSGWPGTRDGPRAPPLSRAARESTRSPECSVVGPWQPWHFSTNTGRTFFSKNSRSGDWPHAPATSTTGRKSSGFVVADICHSLSLINAAASSVARRVCLARRRCCSFRPYGPSHG